MATNMQATCPTPEAPTIPTADHADFTLTTAEFAAINKIKPESVRVRLSTTGHYFGVRPLRCANRRLLWPAVVVKA